MHNQIYLDNSATTRVCDSAVAAAAKMMTEIYGNPSSLHSLGIDAEKCVRRARETVAQKLSARPEEIIFTSGGTESNNMAVFGTVEARKRRGKRIITSAIEHPSVMGCMRKLEQEGFELIILPVDGNGRISIPALEETVNKDTILISVMHVNNETGTIQPIELLKQIAERKKAPALIHVDAVQSFGKLPIRPERIGVDLLSLSGHKIHAPKGIGALYVSRKARICPRTYGGGQENDMRSGTEATPLIAALGAAIEELPEPSVWLSNQRELNQYLRDKLSSLPGICINSPEDALPCVFNFSVPGYRSEVLLHYLASNDIYVSSGSACAKGKGSHVLSAMGLENSIVDSALRISFSRYTQKHELDSLVDCLRMAQDSILRI